MTRLGADRGCRAAMDARASRSINRLSEGGGEQRIRTFPSTIIILMSVEFPSSAKDFLTAGLRFAASLSEVKKTAAITDYGWYSYESLTALPLLAELLGDSYSEILDCCRTAPIADLGCADGDLAVMLASFGATVDAIDHKETNFNQMRGVSRLRDVLRLPVSIFDIDIDRPFALPQSNYGLILFLGTLYHLRNPIYVLDQLAAAADWCVLSTRIAQVTPAGGRIETEALAYFADDREVNNDPTNFWIFSPAGLLRLLRRSGWIPVAHRRVGCSSNSDPVNPAKDERMFVLMRSHIRHPDLYVHPGEGWYEIEDDRWCWTAKAFSLLVSLPPERRLSEFALRFTVPDIVIETAGRIALSCRVQDEPAGAITCETPETIEFRGKFPSSAAPGTLLTLDFSVQSSFVAAKDSRDLGVVITLLGPESRGTSRIPFRVS